VLRIVPDRIPPPVSLRPVRAPRLERPAQPPAPREPGTGRHTVELEDGEDFLAWAVERWPRERFTVQLDPWQLSQD
jgi:hypothetical protein